MARPEEHAERKRRILILGAGIYQLPLIVRAKRMGLETHVVSYRGDFPGIALADRFHECDTTDIAGVVALARSEAVDAVVTAGSDVCVPTVGAVCDALGLAGTTRAVAELISSKDKFRSFQARHGLNAPRFEIVSEAGQVSGALGNLHLPLIFKPVDSSGSRGIVRLEHADPGRAIGAYEHASTFSRRGEVCIEEDLRGMEVGGNALLHEGRIVFLAITAKHMEGFLVRGHSYPCVIGRGQQDAVRSEIERACELLGYRTGALNFDVMVDDDRATIIELGARLGGNGLTDLTTQALCYDVETEIVRLALGEAPRAPPAGPVHPCGSWVFGATREGRLEDVADVEELKRALPEVYHVSHAVTVGAHVHPLVHNANQLGYILFSIPAGETWAGMVRRIEECFVLRVEGADALARTRIAASAMDVLDRGDAKVFRT